MKERIEDLGRLAVLLDQVLDLEIFEMCPVRSKDFFEYFDGLNDDEKKELITSLPYQIEHLKNALNICIEIAEGREGEI